MRLPKIRVTTAMSGSTHSATSVIPPWMWAMNARAPMPVNTVLVPYMIAGPQSMRTACRSLVARAIRSPV